MNRLTILISLLASLQFACNGSTPEPSIDSNTLSSSEEVLTEPEPIPEEYIDVLTEKLPMFAINQKEGGEHYLTINVKTISLNPKFGNTPIDKVKMDFYIVDDFDDLIYTTWDNTFDFRPDLREGTTYEGIPFTKRFNSSSKDYTKIMSMYKRDDLTVKTDVKAVVFNDGSMVKDNY